MRFQVLWFLLLCGTSSGLFGQESQSPDDKERIPGTWKVSSVTRDGQSTPAERVAVIQLTFDKTTLSVVPHWPCVKNTRMPQIAAAKSAAKENQDNKPSATSEKELARQYFEEAAQLCQRDDGKLWGVSLAGPMIFVDPKTRLTFANQADAEGLLKRDGEIHVGLLPDNIPVANYSLVWASERWTMVMWPLPDDANARRTLMMHESWHRIQADVGLPMTGPDNSHLDTLDGRYWLQLEWRALRKALVTTGEAQRSAIADALQCRRHRRALCADSAGSERQLEMHEGMAEYTGVVLSGQTVEQQRHYIVKHLDEKPTAYPSFTRSFAYVSGPAWGLLLDQVKPGWNKSAKPETDLGDLLQAACGIELPALTNDELSELTRRIDTDGLLARETEREENRMIREKELRKRFVDGPVLTLPLEKTQISFNPAELVPIPGEGTWYKTARVSDLWGTLQVTDGMVTSVNGDTVRVPAPDKTTTRPLRGNGWELELAEGWAIASIAGTENFELKASASSKELLDADRAFAAATAERGLDGWMSYMAEDIAKVQRPGEKLLRGKDGVRQNDQQIFANPDRKLVWEPVDAHLFSTGDHGVTSGRYRMIATENGEEKTLSQGGYITWWRKEPDGTWKVIFDTGSPDPVEK